MAMPIRSDGQRKQVGRRVLLDAASMPAIRMCADWQSLEIVECRARTKIGNDDTPLARKRPLRTDGFETSGKVEPPSCALIGKSRDRCPGAMKRIAAIQDACLEEVSRW